VKNPFKELYVSQVSIRTAHIAVWLVLMLSNPAWADAAAPAGLLFRVSADHGLTADVAKGEAEPNFADKVEIKRDPIHGAYIEASGEQVLSWHAQQNIYAQRGTLSFYWRPHEPVGPTPFPLFRVGYADHTSWDMAWLRIDWNGHGYDAFVTDDNLARVRVSHVVNTPPAADQWVLLTFTWDETQGVALYVDGESVAHKQQTAALDAGLDQFGPNSRIISPHQVQSAYQFIRGTDIDDIRIYDHALESPEVAALAKSSEPSSAAPRRLLSQSRWREEWWFRHGWNRPADPPPYLADARTWIRKVEFTDIYDLKERMTAASDGIAETTWPGVYNRSRLPGRHDYFELPDWNVYVEGGKSVTFLLPDESWNRIEFQGAAYGSLSYVASDGKEVPLGKRAQGELRTVHSLASLKAGKLRFDNVVQETPIQELEALNVVAGEEPAGQTLSYVVRAGADPAMYPALDALSEYVRGRFVADEQAMVAALPSGAPTRARSAPPVPAMPLIHVLVPADFRMTRAAGPLNHFAYGWQGLDAGLDGIAIDLPPLNVKPTHGALFPLNIKIADPLSPGRDLIDVSVSIKPGEARTIFLDTRDRMLPPGKSLMLSIAGAGEDFNADALDGLKIRLKFKPRADALAEHIADRLAQARDNLAFLVEEHTVSRRLARYERLEAELGDLLRVDPGNRHGREMWAEINPEQGSVPVTLPIAPADVPRWAFLQVEDLKRVHRFVEWWIDHRQVDYGDFGGGISDDDDLTQQWPPLALMGVMPDKVKASLNALVDAAYRNGMLSPGLGTIKTDELHTYEEGVNAKSEAMYLNYGDPKAVERLMQTAREYPKIIERGPDGHTHIVSRLFSATSVTREGPWGWSHPYSYLILHPGMLLADYNGDPAMRATIVALADGHLAHSKKDPNGHWDFPEDINAVSGNSRGKLVAGGRGNVATMQLFWAAYRWTGDEKYLVPLRGEMARGPLHALDELNSDVIDMLGERATWGAALKAQADGGSRDPFALYEAWRTSGDTSYLEKVYADEIVTAEQRMWMVTEAHWWSDRVELFSDILQRSRLGGLALRRNQLFPGHIVSWRFDEPSTAEQVGILVSDSTPKHFRITAFNLANQPIHATMTGWDVTAGRWHIKNTTPGSVEPERNSEFERTASVDMAFPSRQQASWEFTLAEAHAPVIDRADLGIGADDVRSDGQRLRVTVHYLGVRAAGPAIVTLEDSTGRELSRAQTPALPGVSNFQASSASVTLHRPTHQQALKVRVTAASGEREVTLLNNVVTVP
jgi:hypothetical protein